MNWTIENARIVTVDGEPCDRGALRTSNERIVELGAHVRAKPGDQVLDAAGRVLMPGFVDAHTHAMWSGDRLDEFEQRLGGASYLEILSSGGGILSTVRAVRAASEEQLSNALLERLRVMLREGTTSVEVKSGYGLTTNDELKMLRAIRRAQRDFPGGLVPTALLGHAKDPRQPRFVDTVIDETLVEVSREFAGIAVDAYCEEGAWAVSDCRRLLSRARALGHPVRLHADQFHSLGGVELAIELRALSVDHLEASTPALLQQLATSSTVGVMLPASGFALDGRYGDGRTFLDAGGKLVIASNFNPGSSPTSSMPLVVALAVRELGITVGEAIAACTRNAAQLLGFTDRGVLAVGSRADFILLRHRDERALAYELGGNPVDAVFVGGERVA